MTDTPVPVPPDRNLGDPGHINDHNLLSAGIEALDSKFTSKLGLDLITAETFSAVSYVPVNGCFTATYANYKVLLSGTASTGVSSSIRLRASGTDDSGSNYLHGRYFVGAAQAQAAGNTNNSVTTSWPVLVFNGSILASASVDIFSPQKTTQSAGHVQAGGPFLDLYGLSHNQTTAYDGFSIILNTGNITGTVRVYGYKD